MCVLKGRRRARRLSFCLARLMADLISGIKLEKGRGEANPRQTKKVRSLQLEATNATDNMPFSTRFFRAELH
jgi:hypothetical protein